MRLALTCAIHTHQPRSMRRRSPKDTSSTRPVRDLREYRGAVVVLASSDTDLSDQLRNSFAPPLLRCGVLDVSGRRCVFPSRARLCRTYASSLFHTTSGQRRAVYDGEGVLTFVRAGVDRRRMLGPFRCSSEAPFRRLLRCPTGSLTVLAVERTRPTAPSVSRASI